MRKIIVVTGGAGFVGANLIELLIRRTSYKILSIDNYSSGTKKNHYRNKNVNYKNAHTKDINLTLGKYKKKIKELKKRDPFNYTNF